MNLTLVQWAEHCLSSGLHWTVSVHQVKSIKVKISTPRDTFESDAESSRIEVLKSSFSHRRLSSCQMSA
jgi:hypothetical protein